jgi:hypothetical protein
MKFHHKRIQTLASLVVLLGFVTGAPSLVKLIRKVDVMIDDLRVDAAGGGRHEDPAPTEPGGAVTGRGIPPGCLRFDESGEQVGLWRDECEQCKTGNTFDLRCIREKGIDPFQTPPRPAASTTPVP